MRTMSTLQSCRDAISLDGTWSIIFDPGNVGEIQGWDREACFLAQAQARAIEVPSCWEEVEQDYEGVAWYGRVFDGPANWKGKAVELNFGAVNYVAEVWLNGHVVGFHEGGYTPFSFEVGDLLKCGQRNFLVVRVIGPLITRQVKIDGIGPNEMPHWRGALVGGIWQSVELVATSRVYVRDLFVEPHIARGAATLHAILENANLEPRSIWLDVTVRPYQDERAVVAHARLKLEVAPGPSQCSVEVQLTDPVLWSLDNPYLYLATAVLQADDEVLDAFTVRFGMREFRVQGDRFTLNGQPFFMKAAFWEGLYPTTLANPPSADMVRREITLAKQAGFNTLRPWRKPQPPLILDLADEMGILVIGCPPIECMNHWPELSPQLEWRLRNEVEQLVLRDRNHVCIPYWEILNEVLRPALARLKHKLALLARQHDPTRLIIDESGGYAGGAHYYLPYSAEPVLFNELHCYLRAPVDDSTHDFLRTVGSPVFDASLAPGMRAQPISGELTVVSEVGYGGLSDLPKDAARYCREGNPKTPDYRYHVALLESLERLIAEQNLHEVFPTASELCLASQEIQALGNKLQIEALRLNPQIRGYCLHAYTDGDWIYGAGILDIWRDPKKAYASMGEVNQPVYLAIRVQPSNVYAGQTVALSIDLVNEAAEGQAVIRVQVADASGRFAFGAEDTVRLQSGTSCLVRKQIDSTGLDGNCLVTASLVQDGSILAQNSYRFLAVAAERLRVPQVPFDAIDPDQALTAFCRNRDLKVSAFRGERPSGNPVFVACENAADRQTFDALVCLMDYVTRGGVAVFLDPPLIREPGVRQFLPRKSGKSPLLMPEENSLISTGLFPYQLESRWGTGHWIPVNHVVRDHPVFANLPSRCFMGPEYQNVCPEETMVGLEAEAIAGSISIQLGRGHEHRNYLGLNTFYWGSDLAAVGLGKGKLILSTLRILPCLGKDPVADIIFGNLVAYASALAGPVEPVGRQLAESFKQFGVAFEQWRAAAPNWEPA